jgi:hypothetical protein
MSELIPQLTQQLFNGLSLGAIYALIAIGYTMVNIGGIGPSVVLIPALPASHCS